MPGHSGAAPREISFVEEKTNFGNGANDHIALGLLRFLNGLMKGKKCTYDSPKGICFDQFNSNYQKLALHRQPTMRIFCQHSLVFLISLGLLAKFQICVSCNRSNFSTVSKSFGTTIFHLSKNQSTVLAANIPNSLPADNGERHYSTWLGHFRRVRSMYIFSFCRGCSPTNEGK